MYVPGKGAPPPQQKTKMRLGMVMVPRSLCSLALLLAFDAAKVQCHALVCIAQPRALPECAAVGASTYRLIRALASIDRRRAVGHVASEREQCCGQQKCCGEPQSEKAYLVHDSRLHKCNE